MRPIDADKVIKPATIHTMSKKDLVEAIKNAQTLDVKPIIHAYWKPVHEQVFLNGHLIFKDGVRCSQCNEGHSGRNYCEECGAIMDAKEPEEWNE